mmetsp:Transcript_19308/g.61176  ORF Transcript_19308/g.61176 Transcript_19308/m.61176 type:complete len:377 (-) Transcript_19308:771-1901(-)
MENRQSYASAVLARPRRAGRGRRANHPAALSAAALLALQFSPADAFNEFGAPMWRQASTSAAPPVSRRVPHRAQAVRCSITDEPSGYFDDEEEKERLELGRQKMEEIFQADSKGGAETLDETRTATERLLAQLFPSSQMVNSDSLPSKFIFVDEVTCIGCTHCRFVAPKTFMLEDDFGRARVFQQGGDKQELIDEAIECCPVECIHQVSHTELVRLENYREEQLWKVQAKYWKSRLVGPEIGIPNVPNWWTPLMDSAQPAWAGLIQGEQSLSSLGFLPGEPEEKEVELDMWGNPIEAAEDASADDDAKPAAVPEVRALEDLVADIDMTQVVKDMEVDKDVLAQQFERALQLDGKPDLPDPACDDDEDEDGGCRVPA